MVPTRDDARWKRFVMGPDQFALSNLAVKMLMMRVRIMTMKKDEKSIRDAIAIAHEFFTQNAVVCRADLQAIFP